MSFSFRTHSSRKTSRLFFRRVVYMPTDLDPFRTLLSRIILVVMLFCFLTGILWLDRNGLKDQMDGEVSFSDVIYFTMVTVTTVGYGDIVPVTTRARLIDALVVTPVRIFLWVIFLGTAYQLAFRQFTEVFRMAKLQRSLDQHVVICGFGHTGYSTVKELLAKGTNPDHILVIDPGEERVRIAGELGVVALRGDATQEGLLKFGAFLNEAKAVIISAGRDDTNALILLTVRNLNSRCRVIVSAKEEENVKLFRQGGAQTIISPATYGGYMLAAAVDQQYLADYLEDFLTAGERSISRSEQWRSRMSERRRWIYSRMCSCECIAKERLFLPGNFKKAIDWNRATSCYCLSRFQRIRLPLEGTPSHS